MLLQNLHDYFHCKATYPKRSLIITYNVQVANKSFCAYISSSLMDLHAYVHKIAVVIYRYIRLYEYIFFSFLISLSDGHACEGGVMINDIEACRFIVYTLRAAVRHRSISSYARCMYVYIVGVGVCTDKVEVHQHSKSVSTYLCIYSRAAYADCP